MRSQRDRRGPPEEGEAPALLSGCDNILALHILALHILALQSLALHILAGSKQMGQGLFWRISQVRIRLALGACIVRQPNRILDSRNGARYTCGVWVLLWKEAECGGEHG